MKRSGMTEKGGENLILCEPCDSFAYLAVKKRENLTAKYAMG